MNSSIKFPRKLINQAEAARQLNISQSYLSMILNGHRKSEKIVKRLNELFSKYLKAA